MWRVAQVRLRCVICSPPPQPLRSEGPVNMEHLPVNNGNGQSYGYTLYETAIGNSGGTLNAMNHVRDRALVRTWGEQASAYHRHALWKMTELTDELPCHHSHTGQMARFHFQHISTFFSPPMPGLRGQTVCWCFGLWDARALCPRGEGNSNCDCFYIYIYTVCLYVCLSGQSPEINIFSPLFTVICKNTRFWLPAKHVDLIVHVWKAVSSAEPTLVRIFFFFWKVKPSKKQKIQKTFLKWILNLLSTSGRQNSELTGGELGKSELWENPGRSAQR